MKKIPLYIAIDEHNGAECSWLCPFRTHEPMCLLFKEPLGATGRGEYDGRCSSCLSVFEEEEEQTDNG